MQAFEIRFHAVLVELIKAERNKEAQHLADGRATDWADYNRIAGVLEGLNRARDLADKLAKDTTGRDRAAEKFMETNE